MNTRSLAELVATADKINAFTAKYSLVGHPSRYGRGTDAALASASACVCDDEGGPLEADATPVGTPRLTVDIEFFSTYDRDNSPKGRADTIAADHAESDILQFCKGLGFEVKHETNIGSGQHGKINQITLS